MTAYDAELLAHVGLQCEANTVAWCPVNGLIAVGGRIDHDLACVHILSVQCPTRTVPVYVPLQGPSDKLVSVSWSPAGCRRVLLTATSRGRLLAWSQQPPDQLSKQHITIEDWWAHEVSSLSSTTTGSDSTSTVQNQTEAHLVALRWLQPSLSWTWNSAVMQQVDFRSGPIHGLFAPQSAAAAKAEDPAVTAAPPADDADELGFHWVRPGVLAVVAVLSDGTVAVCWAQWSAYGQLQWSTTSNMRLEPTPGVTVQAADATVCDAGVAVCYSLQQEPAALKLVHLQGNPLHAQCCQISSTDPTQLSVQSVAVNNQLTAESSITVLSWDPNSNGTRIASLVNSSSSTSNEAESHNGMLVLFQLQQQQLQQVAHTLCATVLEPQQQQLTWLVDNLLAVCQGQQLQLYQINPLQQVAAGFTQPGGRTGCNHRGVVQATAASPHGVALAAILSRPSASNVRSHSRLLLYNIPAFTAGSAGAVGAAAGRLLYALLQQQHTWDVVQHVLCAACRSQSQSDAQPATFVTGLIQPAVVSDVLSLVDHKVSVQQPTLRSTYSALWDVLKLAMLSVTPGDEARAVGVDLRLRLISSMMKSAFEVLREDATTRQREARMRLPGLIPLHNFLADVVRFELACLKTWVVRRSKHKEGRGLAQHVPCVRHFLDIRPCNMLMMLYVLTHSSTQLTKEDALYAAYKQLTKAVPPSREQNWEKVMRELIPGSLQLHYPDAAPDCLNSLALPPEQLLQRMEGNAVWQQQPVMSDADITAEAMRLGLLPVRPPKAAGLFRRELQLYSSLRSISHSSLDADGHEAGRCLQTNRLKRRNWERQLAAAMGDVLPGSGCAGDGMTIDLAHIIPLQTGKPGQLVSVDGAVLAQETAPALDEGGKAAPKLVVDQCAYGWMYACPISGEVWMRGN